MRVIYKWAIPLDDRAHVVDGRPIHLAKQNGKIIVWCEVDLRLPQQSHELQLVGTGHKYAGRALFTVADPPFIWHLIDVKADD